MEIWTLWNPSYWASGTVKAVTAVASVGTAIALVPLLPKVVALPSPKTLEASNRELASVNRELETFSYSVSHDLRAPLRAIDGFAELLVHDHASTLDPEGQRLLRVIRDNTDRMGALIDNLLRFSQLNRKPLEEGSVDMTALAQSVVEDVRRADGGQGVEVVIQPLPAARADQALLRQVLTNLVGNAFKFTRKQPHPRIEVGGCTEPREVTYYVRDNGAGFDMRYAAKLFGVFQRLHRVDEFDGTGVGLALVQRIVHRHGGRVWAEGEVDRGATFHFTLPRGS
jgi:light-regulated signal transduction histidine kinase (bacteriophytochrome)